MHFIKILIAISTYFFIYFLIKIHFTNIKVAFSFSFDLAVVLCCVSVKPLNTEAVLECSVCMSFIRLGHHNR